MAEIKYLDFDLLIERAEEGYTARVLNSPAGQASADFSLPFSELELENFLLRIGRTRRGVRRLESPEMEAAKSFGGRLFDAVFGGEARGCLRSSLDEASRQEAGLRVRLRLASAPELADLPWEYLYNSSLNRFLSLSTETPIVRYLDLPERIRPLEVKPPLRVLVMISSPSDHPPLDVEGEWAKLKEALGDLEQRGLVTLERLEDATLTALQRRLRRGEYHVFHFVGHGGFDERAQDGVLLLEDEHGRGRPVSGQYLGTLLHDERTLRLAILNACEGARTSRSDPFAGTAQSLVQQGIPAVIAMQFEITDEAAITLAHEFYTALADGYSVDAALAEARKAIFAQENDVEWGTPVLYLRAPDGRIFDIERVSEEERKSAQVSALYREAQTAMAGKDWATAIDKLQAVLALDPAHAEATARLNQARQQQELATLYATGRKHYEAGRRRQALECFRRVQDVGGDYKDVGRLMATVERTMAQEEVARAPRPAPSKPSRWLWVGIPAALVLLLLVCGGGYLLLKSLPPISGPTPTPEQVVVVPTDTPTPTPTPTPTDTTPPTVDITHSPEYPTQADQITFTATASDPGGTKRIQILVNQVGVKECPGSPCVYVGGPYPDSTSVSYGANAWDAAGNRGWTGYKSVSLELTCVTYSTGLRTVRGTWLFDLDRGVEDTLTGDADFWWEQVTNVERYLTPRNGAELAVFGTTAPSCNDCARAALSSAKINGSNNASNQIPEGTYVCARTSEGRYASFRINGYGYDLQIGYTTWEK